MPIGLRHHLIGHVAHSAEWAGFKGLANGKLLEAAERAGYQVFITTDRGIPHQQRRRGISIIILRAAGNKLDSFLPLIEQVGQILEQISPGETRDVPERR